MTVDENKGDDNTEERSIIIPSAPAKPCLNDDNYDTVQMVRKLPPANYSIKIGSFSSVMETFGRSGTGNFESTEFSAGGHKWVLSVYPCGNNKEMGEGHLSFYVKLVDNLHSDMIVYATYKFFVYDQIRDIYLTIQDLRERRFHALKTEWGIAKALDLSIFKDPSNGFLINDCCQFGVEVFVIDTTRTTAIMSMVRNQANHVYTWKIPISRDKHGFRHDTPYFNAAGQVWQLCVYYKGFARDHNSSFGMALHLINHNSVTRRSKLYVKYELCVKNKDSGKDHKITFGPKCFSPSVRSLDCPAFMPVADLKDSSKGIFMVKASHSGQFLRKMFCLA